MKAIIAAIRGLFQPLETETLTKAARIVCGKCWRGEQPQFVSSDNSKAYQGYTHNGGWCPASDIWKAINHKPDQTMRLNPR